LPRLVEQLKTEATQHAAKKPAKHYFCKKKLALVFFVPGMYWLK
jgi:hypothetical protein